MFRISFFCEDRDLAKVLHSLAGVVRGQPEIVPVAGTNPTLSNGHADETRSRGRPLGSYNTKPRQSTIGKLEIANQGGADVMFVRAMKTKGLSEVNAAMAKQILKDLGLSPTSYSHVLATARDSGLMKKGRKLKLGFMWNITPAGEKAGE